MMITASRAGALSMRANLKMWSAGLGGMSEKEEEGGCPFEPREKQALLEADTLSDRAATILTLLRMASLDQDSSPAHH